MNCGEQRLYQKVTSRGSRIINIPFLDSQSPYFKKKNSLELFKERALKMIPKYGRTEAQSWP